MQNFDDFGDFYEMTSKIAQIVANGPNWREGADAAAEAAASGSMPAGGGGALPATGDAPTEALPAADAPADTGGETPAPAEVTGGETSALPS